MELNESSKGDRGLESRSDLKGLSEFELWLASLKSADLGGGMGGLLLGDVMSILSSSSSSNFSSAWIGWVGLLSVLTPLLLVVETVESDS